MPTASRRYRRPYLLSLALAILCSPASVGGTAALFSAQPSVAQI